MPETVTSAPALAPGQRITVRVTDVAFGGEGVARTDDFVVFVPFALQGETVEVEITEVKRRFARGRLERVVQPSPQRVEPRCAYFGACGGCQYQHLDYAAQVELKHRQIVEILRRLGGLIAPPVTPVVPCPQPYAYRNRIMVRTQWDKGKQGLNLGFLRHDNRLVVDVETCAIAEPALNIQLAQTRLHPPPKGGLKVVLRVQPVGWEVPPDSFFQNNFHLLPALVAAVGTALEESGASCLVDAYCGVGFFSVELADRLDRFVGLELDAPAVRAARRNAAQRGRTNGEFLQGDTAALLPGVLSRLDAAKTALLIDPPRTGCPKPMLTTLAADGPGQIVYVSCHPATLARDLAALCGSGHYRLERVVPLDMFPQTQHVECVADLRRLAPPDSAAGRGCA